MVFTTPKSSSDKLILTVIEVQQFLRNSKSDSKDGFLFVKWAMYNVRRKVCVHFKTYTDHFKITPYRYRNKLYLKFNEIDLKLTEYHSLLAKRLYLFVYNDRFLKRCFVLDETTVVK